MARVLYLDCFSGISGDMLLGAALDAGLPLDELRRVVEPLAGSGCLLDASSVTRAGVTATKFSVQEPASAAALDQTADHQSGGHQAHHHAHQHDHDHDLDHQHDHVHQHDQQSHGHAHGEDGAHGAGRPPVHGHRTLAEIYALIDRSALPSGGKATARRMFERLAEAESAIHGVPMDRVHLHEVGAIDSIVDIVGTVFAMDWFRADRVVCSPLNVGGGMVRSAHGLFPVPAPATLRILGSAPVYAGPVLHETVTPTGALIATTYATSFGVMPPMRIERIGYGAGDRNPVETPNVLRVLVGEEGDAVERSDQASHVAVIECQIDDMNPQLFGPLMDRLFAMGALDVYYTPVQMKKNRPGTLVTVLAQPGQRDALAEVLFRETTTIGIRHQTADRICLTRELIRIETPIGPARVKRAMRGGVEVNAVAEFDDCVRLAAAHGRSVKDVQSLVMQTYRTGRGQS